MLIGQLAGATPEMTAAEEEYQRRQAELDALKAVRSEHHCWRVTPLAHDKWNQCRSINKQINEARRLRNIAKSRLNGLQRSYGFSLKKEQKQSFTDQGQTPQMPQMPQMPQATSSISPTLLIGGGIAAIGVVALLLRK